MTHDYLNLLDEIHSAIEAIAGNTSLRDPANFAGRAQALDTLETLFIDDFAGGTPGRPNTLAVLRQSAEELAHTLRRIDDALFERLRAAMRAGTVSRTGFKELIATYVGTSGKRPDQVGYDTLDLFVNGLLLTDTIPEETIEREPEMVYYQQTPARVIVALIERAQFTERDVFYDLGAGLGLAPMLVSLLSPASAKGVEIEPVFCEYARARAADLNLSRIAFVHADARAADYADGTAFFLYTPFVGSMLQAVLSRLQDVARTRTITLFSYGPCTSTVSQQPWLAHHDGGETNAHRLAVFRSVSA